RSRAPRARRFGLLAPRPPAPPRAGLFVGAARPPPPALAKQPLPPLGITLAPAPQHPAPPLHFQGRRLPGRPRRPKLGHNLHIAACSCRWNLHGGCPLRVVESSCRIKASN